MPGGGRLHVSLSIGITAVRGEDTIPSILDRADIRMHQAKQAGKNRMVSD